jgi:hypothetical protein
MPIRVASQVPELAVAEFRPGQDLTPGLRGF